MISLPPEILTRPPEAGARAIARRLLDEARSALARIDDPGDSEGLHDFRVALRRLHSSLRAYLPQLPARATQAALKRARALGSRTNAARDLEVQIAWLEARRSDTSEPESLALGHLVDELSGRLRFFEATAPETVRAQFEALCDDMDEVLEDGPEPARAARSTASFATLSADLIERHGAQLRSRLAEVTSVFDEEPAHRARIQAKRTRYLSEPFVELLEGGPELLHPLKQLQDILGEQNDLRMLVASLTSSLELATQLRARARLDAALGQDSESVRLLREHALEHGLIALAERIGKRRRELFANLEREWLGAASAGFFAALAAFAAKLRGFDRGAVEIERKYLLVRLPEICRSARSVRIEQGWLEGRQVRERLRRVHSDEGARHLRTVKLGTGLQRAEFEEEIRAAVFEQLWPLTAGCRVHKRRYLVPDGELVWEVDEFLDRDLTLAELELPSADTTTVLPQWLADVLVREVTDEPEFTNLKLAK